MLRTDGVRAASVLFAFVLSVALQLGCSAKRTPFVQEIAGPSAKPAAAAAKPAKDPFKKLREALGSAARGTKPPSRQRTGEPSLATVVPSLPGRGPELPTGTSGPWSPPAAGEPLPVPPDVPAPTSGVSDAQPSGSHQRGGTANGGSGSNGNALGLMIALALIATGLLGGATVLARSRRLHH